MQSGSLKLRGGFLAADTPVERVLDSLLEGLRAGDVRAVAEAYDRHHGALRTFTRRLVGDMAAAEDLVQEVFIALPSAARRFDGRSSLATFLVAIAINHARHHVRSAARRRRMLEHLAIDLPALPADPERTVIDRRRAHALFVALDALSMDHRAAFVLCELEERSSAEVAEIVGATEGTVRARLFHARKKLRVLLEREIET